MNAKEFIELKDKEHGKRWTDDDVTLIQFFEEYAALKVAEAEQRRNQPAAPNDKQP